MEDSHVVELHPIGEESHAQQSLFSALQYHPLAEISASPGHLLLLKLWQREEELVNCRIGAKETMLDCLKRETFKICSIFFFFQGILLTLLFTTSLGQSEERRACRGWWLPGLLSVTTSFVLIASVQLRIFRYWKIHRKLQRERGDGRALARCVQELRMKGASFDLSKEPQATKRMKSSSVEIQWRPVQLCLRNAVSIFLICLSGMIFPTCKFILCG